MIELHNLLWPPTVNHRYIPRGGRLILSPEHRAYKMQLNLFLIAKFKHLKADHLKGKQLNVEIHYCGPWDVWFTKKNTIKKIDVDSRNKTLLDVVFPFLKLDDSQIFDLRLKKLVSGKELTASVLIGELENDL